MQDNKLTKGQIKQVWEAALRTFADRNSNTPTFTKHLEDVREAYLTIHYKNQ